MIGRINKTRKSFIGAVAMSLVLLLGSALGFLLETGIGQITMPGTDSWTNYTSAPTGEGTSSDPYKVTTPRELAWFLNNGSNAYVVLENDIDLAEHSWSGIPSGKITNFKGQNHIISNLNGTQGLFSSGSSLTIQDFTLSNVNISGKGYVGAVTGMFGTITNITVSSGTVRGINYVGGISGGNGVTVKNCINNATVIGTSSGVGGIIGYTASRGAYNCINTGDVFGDSNVGGIGGHVDGSTDCYAECTVTGNSNVGGVIGGADGGWSALRNSGFNGKIIVNSSTPSNIGSLIGAPRTILYGGFNNNFGVAEIHLLNTTDTSAVHKFGADATMLSGTSNITSSYSYSKVITSSGTTEYRKYKVGSSETTPFSDFAYDQHINDGYPFYRPLFAVGQFIECDPMSYLEEYGFDVKEPFEIKNDGTHYYVRLGEYPQTYVGDSLNTTLKSWYTSSRPSSVDSYTNDTGTSGTVTNYAYKYTDGNTYVRIISALIYGSGYTFENGTTATNGNEYWFKIEPIKWWVLNYSDYKNGAAPIALTERALTANVSWNKSSSDKNLWSKTCHIRNWLNYQFYNDAFDEDAKSNIKTVLLKNNTETNNGTDGGGENTTDTVWLLSYAEVRGMYFTSDTQRLCSPTDYAIANKVYMYTNASYVTDARPNGGTCTWRLRSATSMSTTSGVVGSTGSGNDYYNVTYTDSAVRPALTLNI